MDFQTQNIPGGGDAQDTRWRYSSHGESSARSGQLDAAAFLAVGLVVNGRVPSGAPLAYNSSTNLYGPLTEDPGTNVLAGFVNDNMGVAIASPTSKPTCSVLVHGIIKRSYLPTPHRDAIYAIDGMTGTFTFTED